MAPISNFHYVLYFDSGKFYRKQFIADYHVTMVTMFGFKS